MSKTWIKTQYFNSEELNRIENNIVETLNLLKFMNENVAIGNTVNNRDYTSTEYADSLNRIENNIKILKDYFYEPLGWATPKVNWTSNSEYKDSFSYVDVNRMEKNIKLLYELILQAKANIQYCGVFACGDDTRIF